MATKYTNAFRSNIMTKNKLNNVWRLTKRVVEFVIEKYIEISIGISISTGIVYADPDPHSSVLQYNSKKVF